MLLGDALNGVLLTPETRTYQDIQSAFDPKCRLKSYNLFYKKYLELDVNCAFDDSLLSDYFEIRIALNLSADGLLPKTAQKALSLKTIDLVNEAMQKKITLDSFHIQSPKKGPKRDNVKYFSLISDVYNELNDGRGVLEAYQVVAKKYHKSPDSIRSEFQKFKRKLKSFDEK